MLRRVVIYFQVVNEAVRYMKFVRLEIRGSQGSIDNLSPIKKHNADTSFDHERKGYLDFNKLIE